MTLKINNVFTKERIRNNEMKLMIYESHIDKIYIYIFNIILMIQILITHLNTIQYT